MAYKRPVRSLKFSVVKERKRWLVRYKGVGGKSRIATKEEVQLQHALTEANEDRAKQRIQKNRFEYATKGTRYAVELARQSCNLQDACKRLIDVSKQAAHKLRQKNVRPDALIRAGVALEHAMEDFDKSVDDAREELGVAAPGKEKK